MSHDPKAQQVLADWSSDLVSYAGPVSWTTTHGDKVTVRQRWWFGAGRRDAAHWQWYWQRMAGDGSILCHSEGYVKRAHCLRMAERINPKVERTLPLTVHTGQVVESDRPVVGEDGCVCTLAQRLVGDGCAACSGVVSDAAEPADAERRAAALEVAAHRQTFTEPPVYTFMMSRHADGKRCGLLGCYCGERP